MQQIAFDASGHRQSVKRSCFSFSATDFFVTDIKVGLAKNQEEIAFLQHYRSGILCDQMSFFSSSLKLVVSAKLSINCVLSFFPLSLYSIAA